MKDQYGRQINYMRVSVTDRCNLRCIYCMPEEGIKQVSHQDILTYDEIVQIVNAAAAVGITRIKLTGGEPLVRKNLAGLVEALRAVPGIEEVTVTTNGVLLKEQIGKLAKAGISAVNISVDSLDPDMYASIARKDALAAVLEGMEAAVSCPGLKVKINCVPLKGLNEEEWVRLAQIARERPIDVRFIEMMPMGLGRDFQGSSQKEVLERLRETFGPEQYLDGNFGNGPATYVHFNGFAGKIGFISALSHKFCSECNRIRMTAEGFLKPCLQYASGEDLREMIRNGASEEELIRAINRTIYYKPACHHFEVDDSAEFEHKKMFRIGG
ncbi:GTP 3',8-cyclase MoaA [Lachnoclostridium phocaeense]|uniref:GTP 3',8-cyclase MoaA n=1 Tax=Lachnoclostridium phocaeense TaxID=1871021 RepID=UPI00248F073D|nr:GTP 3',8-cyclase MoaA [Lachnoclostridium phocaeense]